LGGNVCFFVKGGNSPLILQPGPAALTDGLDAILAAWRKQ
jgi:hypothetical protein